MPDVNKRALIGLYLLLSRRLRRHRSARNRTTWVKNWIGRRKTLGVFTNLIKELELEDTEGYRRFLRLTPDSFKVILEMVTPLIEKKQTFMREAISAGERLGITIRFLATGESFRSLSFLYRVGERTISDVVKETCQAISLVLKGNYLKIPRSTEEWLAISEKFQDKWNYPFCLGAIDGKHISIRQPQNSGSIYYNYKSFFSIILLALVDADYKFLYVDIGAAGRCGDAGVFSSSTLFKAMNSKSLNFPAAGFIEGTDKLCHYHFVADDAFPLREDLLKPFPHKSLEYDKKIFNYRFSRARRVVENSFGILANRFRVFLSTIALEPDDVDHILLASCCLHNFMIENQPSLYNPHTFHDNEDDDHSLVDGEWRRQGCLTEIQGTRSRNSAVAAKTQRDLLKDFFVSERGSVPWQNDVVN